MTVTAEIVALCATLLNMPASAEKAGAEQTYVSLVETGKQEPCLCNIELLAGGLGVSLRTIFWDL